MSKRLGSQISLSINQTIDEFVALRREFHQHPELAFQELRTSRRVSDLLNYWGYEVAEGVGGTGIVASLKRGESERAIGIRAEMDALPIAEASGLGHASRTEGIMHACGHDGHTAILLCAARELAYHGRFDGTARLIFQPAEETGQGAARMISEGLFEHFPVDRVFALHNWPGKEAGRLYFLDGPVMAAADTAEIIIRGRGSHGAEPHHGIDPVVVAASFIIAMQSIVARNIDPRAVAVATVGSIHSGTTAIVIPDSAELKLTIRTFEESVRQTMQNRIEALASAQAESFGAQAEVRYRRGVPPVDNAADEVEFGRRVAVDVLGLSAVSSDITPSTGGEDFAVMLRERPGSFFFVGNGDSAPLHNPRYDFDDRLIAPAAAFWTGLVEAHLSSLDDACSRPKFSTPRH